MALKKVTAIVRCASLEAVEEALQNLHVTGLTITHVVGFGEYANLFRHDWTSRHARLELFTDEGRVEGDRSRHRRCRADWLPRRRHHRRASCRAPVQDSRLDEAS